MTHLAHNESRLDAIRRAEGQVTAELVPVFKVIERDGVYRLEAPKRDPEKPRFPAMFRAMAIGILIGVPLWTSITFAIIWAFGG